MRNAQRRSPERGALPTTTRPPAAAVLVTRAWRLPPHPLAAFGALGALVLGGCGADLTGPERGGISARPSSLSATAGATLGKSGCQLRPVEPGTGS
jgi:hypothetical protein